MRVVRAAVAIGVFALLLPACASATAGASATDGDVKGCFVTLVMREGHPSPLYEPFIKVADKASFSEDGKPEIWGYKLWDLPKPDADGKVRPVNILEEQFIPIGIFKAIKGQRCRCPNYWSAP